ncbi:hypothetical protein V7S43_005020 [Phytophthora oleae]|uniref:FYVE-type domain-containing protein n=1 Tax=Phytophthora oleae TaxID=2107226 RepID=A0ABD3FT73_9STRA
MERLTASISRQSRSTLLLHQSKPPIVALDLPQLDRYHDRAERALTDTIVNYGKLGQTVDPSKWKCLRARQTIRLFRGVRVNSEGQTPLLCAGTLHGRFDDVIEGIYAADTDEMLLMNAVKCPRLADSAVRYTVQSHTPEDPYVFTGIKSATIKVSVASDRDSCYFDKIGMVRQSSGKRMAYHVLQSVDLPDIPPISTHKRVEMSLCYLFEELEDDLVGVYMQGTLNYSTLSYFARSAMSEVLLAHVSKALDCTRAKKLKLLVSEDGPSVSRHSRKKTCYVCKSKPSLFDSLSSCTGCSEHVCKKCRSKEQIFTHSASSACPKQAEFCSVCISKVNLSSLTQLRSESQGDKATQGPASCTVEEEPEDVDGDIQSNQRVLATFVRRVSIQMQELNTGCDERASNLSSMGQTAIVGEYLGVLDSESDEEDVLNASRLKSNTIVSTDKILPEMLHRCSSATFSSSTSFDYDEDNVEIFTPSLLEELDRLQ